MTTTTTNLPGWLVSESSIPGLIESRCYRLDPDAVAVMSASEIDAIRVVAADGLSVSIISGSGYAGVRLNVRILDADGNVMGNPHGHGAEFRNSTEAKRFCLQQGYEWAFESTSLREVR